MPLHTDMGEVQLSLASLAARHLATHIRQRIYVPAIRGDGMAEQLLFSFPFPSPLTPIQDLNHKLIGGLSVCLVVSPR